MKSCSRRNIVRLKNVSQNNSTDCRRLARMSNLWEPDEADVRKQHDIEQVSCFHAHEQYDSVTIGPFIRGKIRRVLNKTRTVPFIRACLI